MKEQLIGYINQINPYGDFDENTPLLEQGIIDSTGLMVFITLIENGFNVTIVDEDVQPDNFKTIVHVQSLLTRYVEKA